MKRIFLILMIFSMLFSCANDDANEIDCALFDPDFPTLFVKLVNDKGENLLENGTIHPDSLRVSGDFANAGFVFNPANEYTVPDADIRKFDNTIKLGIPKQSTFQYLIYFGVNDSILVDFSAKLTRIPCDISYFTPTTVTFKSTEVDLLEESSLQFFVELEL